jgi:hypothetical protein
MSSRVADAFKVMDDLNNEATKDVPLSAEASDEAHRKVCEVWGVDPEELDEALKAYVNSPAQQILAALAATSPEAMGAVLNTLLMAGFLAGLAHERDEVAKLIANPADEKLN